MEITTTTTDQTPRRKAATSALAIVGFITLILIGIALAIYAARYVPVALDRLGLAAVSFDANYEPADENVGISVIEPGETIPFEPIATSTGTTTVVTGGAVADTTGTGTTQPRPAAPTRTRTVAVPVPAPGPYGRADLTVEITATGYCSTNRPDSFRRASEVPDSENGGMQFRVSNIGTNVSGQWDFDYDLPTSPRPQEDGREPAQPQPRRPHGVHALLHGAARGQ